MQLDAVDWLIVRELYRWDVGNHPRGALRAPVAELAKRTGLHRNSVHARLLALRQGGVLLGSAFDPQASVLGFGRAGFGFDGVRPRSAEALERALAPFETVQMGVLALDLVFLHFWHEGDAPRLAREIGRALGAKRVWPSYVAPRPPRVSPALAPLDARLVLALRAGVDRPLSAIARELRVSTRTVERRAKALIESGAGGMAPRFSLARVEGTILVEFIVTDGDARAHAAIARAFPDRVLGPFGPGVPPQVAAPMASLDEAERRRVAAEELPGIRRVDMFLIREFVHPAAFDAFVARVVARAQSSVATV